MAKKVLPKKVLPKKIIEQVEPEVQAHVEATRREPNGKVNTFYEKGAIQETQEEIQEEKTVAGMSKGLTLNLGNYESLKVNVWISKPCENNEEAIMSTLVEVGELIEEHLNYEITEFNANR